MGLWQRFLAYFKKGPSREEQARLEQLRLEKAEAAQQQGLLQQRLQAMEAESRRKDEALREEREANERRIREAREEERRKRAELEKSLETRLRAREEELNSKYLSLLEEVEAKMDAALDEKEASLRRMEANINAKMEVLLSEQNRQMEEAEGSASEASERLAMISLEKKRLAEEQKRLEEADRKLALQREEIRVERNKVKFGERPGLGMTDEERHNLSTVLGTYTFDNFVVGPNNRFPREAALTVAKSPANAYNPLFIYSGVGLGKTHLLSAIGNYIMENFKDLRVAYLSTERFKNELLRAVAENTLEDFRHRYRNVDVLLIDDIQFLGRQEQTQTEFFHTFNTLYNSHKQIVLASDRPPTAIATLEKRLQSRFEGGLITQIKPPELITRKHIITSRASDDDLDIAEDVVDFLAEKISSNIRSLLGAVNRVVAYSNLTGEACTVAMASEVLKDILDDKRAA